MIYRKKRASVERILKEWGPMAQHLGKCDRDYISFCLQLELVKLLSKTSNRKPK